MFDLNNGIYKIDNLNTILFLQQKISKPSYLVAKVDITEERVMFYRTKNYREKKI